jgi:hypothetical protein
MAAIRDLNTPREELHAPGVVKTARAIWRAWLETSERILAELEKGNTPLEDWDEQDDD